MPPFGPERNAKWNGAGNLGELRRTCAVFLFCAATAIPSLAQTFKTLVVFDGSNGAYPSSIVQGGDGKLWGTTTGSGNPSCGTVFKMTPTGTLATAFTFNCTNGNEPGGLTLGTDGNFYGVTFYGGSGNQGTIFKLKPRSGALTVLLSFDGSDGAEPVGNLTLGADGNFYGLTYGGGSSQLGYGTAFKITRAGNLTTLYDFDSTHGSQPYAGPILGTDGNFYGTTYSGGTYGAGTVFKITSKGILTVLHDFGGSGSDGDFPVASLIQARDGNFYGTTADGGPDNDGTVFKITPSGTFTTLHAFVGTDGYNPSGALVQGSDGNFYFAVSYGGANGYGTIFKMTAAGVLTPLHSFDGTDGAGPFMLVQDTDGTFYGLTNFPPNEGTVFNLSVGLNPFVETLPTRGKVGTKVTILGTKLTGATSVSFNGTAAKFTVVSGSEITTTVPIGATTGKVKVTTPSRTLPSNVLFRVTK
jgi:uncharacterized repeat protein (TIGR03803 family)